MKAETKQEKTLAMLLAERWEQTAGKVLQLAVEIPEKNFESKPVDNIRTGGDVVRHLAFWNRYVADTLRGKQADDSANELPLAQYATKALAVEALERTSGEALAALKEHRSALDLKTAELVMTFIEHTSEHYGQLVVYSRLMGLVPPASRAA